MVLAGNQPSAAEARRHLLIGLLMAAASALLFSIKGVLVKWALPQGVDATVLLGLRMGFSLPCFLAIAWWLERRAATPMSGRQRLVAMALGVVGYHGATWFDFQALRFIDVALERMVLYIYPTLVVLMGVALGRQRLTRRMVLALLATYAGVALTWGGGMAMGERAGLGVGLVVASAVAYALYLVLAERWIAAVGGLRFVAVALSAACTTVLVQALLTQPWSGWVQPLPIYGIGLLLAIPGMVIPALLTGTAVRRVGPARFAIVSTLGPVSTVLQAMVVLGERPTVLAWIGIALTIAGGALVGWVEADRGGEA